MAEPVQAQSLAALHALADNPPLHLDARQRRQPREPLVMYIARVPGSRDVFLTTMKPRDKVVSAQDVESSLYYCHLETAEDDVLRASIQDDLAEESLYDDPESLSSDQDTSISHPVLPPRPAQLETHPQPGRTRLPYPDQPALPRRPAPVPEVHPTIARKPVGGPMPTPEPSPALPVRPLGPRPMDFPPSGSRSPEGKENIKPPWGSTKPPLPPRQGSVDAPNQPQASAPRPPLPPRQSTGERRTGPSPLHSPVFPRRASVDVISSLAPKRNFAVTLIRRDPGSGQQWNVGRMVRSAGAGDASGDVSLQLPTSGYTKFDSFALPSSTQPPADPAESESESAPFSRTLMLLRKHGHQGAGGLPFSFTSPWDGPCSFVTGTSGRNLRCRHVFPPPTETSFDMKLALLDSAPVSELRLNLPVVGRRKKRLLRRPSLEAAGAARPSRASLLLPAGAGGFARPQSGLGHGHRPARSVDAGMYDVEDEEDEWDDAHEDGGRLDLSLGRERAGGGFKGKKAKLGKVIVEGEGMLMLDLTVLANMAIWWAVAEEGEV